MNRITHFEFVTPDYAKAAAFYQAVFDWEIEKWDGPIDYWTITSGKRGLPGIDGGGLMQPEGPFQIGTVVTVEVDDIDAAIQKVLANGGEMVFPKDIIPGVGYQAYFRDNCGVIVGLHQRLPAGGEAGQADVTTNPT